MSNQVRIEIRKEQEVYIKNGQIIEPEVKAVGYNVYVSTDEVTAWIGNFTDIESLEEIVSPENIMSSIYETTSDREINIILPVLVHNGYKYNFFGEIRTAIDEI